MSRDVEAWSLYVLEVSTYWDGYFPGQFFLTPPILGWQLAERCIFIWNKYWIEHFLLIPEIYILTGKLCQVQVTPGQNPAKDQVPSCYFLQISFPLKTFSSLPAISISLYVTRKIKIYVQLICNWRRIIFQISFFGSVPILLGTQMSCQ